MKKIAFLTFVSLLVCISDYGYAEQPSQPVGFELKGPMEGEAPSSPPMPVGPEQRPPAPTMGNIFFAAGTVSADDNYFYVIFDRFLLKYILPALGLMRKVDLDIAIAPVTPSISISKDSKYLYIVSNGMLYQIDTTSLEIEKQIKITP